MRQRVGIDVLRDGRIVERKLGTSTTSSPASTDRGDRDRASLKQRGPDPGSLQLNLGPQSPLSTSKQGATPVPRVLIPTPRSAQPSRFSQLLQPVASEIGSSSTKDLSDEFEELYRKRVRGEAVSFGSSHDGYPSASQVTRQLESSGKGLIRDAEYPFTPGAGHKFAPAATSSLINGVSSPWSSRDGALAQKLHVPNSIETCNLRTYNSANAHVTLHVSCPSIRARCWAQSEPYHDAAPRNTGTAHRSPRLCAFRQDLDGRLLFPSPYASGGAALGSRGGRETASPTDDSDVVLRVSRPGETGSSSISAPSVGLLLRRFPGKGRDYPLVIASVAEPALSSPADDGLGAIRVGDLLLFVDGIVVPPDLDIASEMLSGTGGRLVTLDLQRSSDANGVYRVQIMREKLDQRRQQADSSSYRDFAENPLPSSLSAEHVELTFKSTTGRGANGSPSPAERSTSHVQQQSKIRIVGEDSFESQIKELQMKIAELDRMKRELESSAEESPNDRTKSDRPTFLVDGASVSSPDSDARPQARRGLNAESRNVKSPSKEAKPAWQGLSPELEAALQRSKSGDTPSKSGDDTGFHSSKPDMSRKRSPIEERFPSCVPRSPNPEVPRPEGHVGLGHSPQGSLSCKPSSPWSSNPRGPTLSETPGPSPMNTFTSRPQTLEDILSSSPFHLATPRRSSRKTSQAPDCRRGAETQIVLTTSIKPGPRDSPLPPLFGVQREPQNPNQATVESAGSGHSESGTPALTVRLTIRREFDAVCSSQEDAAAFASALQRCVAASLGVKEQQARVVQLHRGSILADIELREEPQASSSRNKLSRSAEQLAWELRACVGNPNSELCRKFDVTKAKILELPAIAAPAIQRGGSAASMNSSADPKKAKSDTSGELPDELKSPEWTLKVRIYEARGLPRAHVWTSPFIRLHMRQQNSNPHPPSKGPVRNTEVDDPDNSDQYRTSTKPKNQNPVWEEEFLFGISTISTADLEIVVMHQGTDRIADEKLGYVRIPISSLSTERGPEEEIGVHERWYSLITAQEANSDADHGKAGEIRVGLNLVRTPEDIAFTRGWASLYFAYPATDRCAASEGSLSRAACLEKTTGAAAGFQWDDGNSAVAKRTRSLSWSCPGRLRAAECHRCYVSLDPWARQLSVLHDAAKDASLIGKIDLRGAAFFGTYSDGVGQNPPPPTGQCISNGNVHWVSVRFRRAGLDARIAVEPQPLTPRATTQNESFGNESANLEPEGGRNDDAGQACDKTPATTSNQDSTVNSEISWKVTDRRALSCGFDRYLDMWLCLDDKGDWIEWVSRLRALFPVIQTHDLASSSQGQARISCQPSESKQDPNPNLMEIRVDPSVPEVKDQIAPVAQAEPVRQDHAENTDSLPLNRACPAAPAIGESAAPPITIRPKQDDIESHHDVPVCGRCFAALCVRRNQPQKPRVGASKSLNK